MHTMHRTLVKLSNTGRTQSFSQPRSTEKVAAILQVSKILVNNDFWLLKSETSFTSATPRRPPSVDSSKLSTWIYLSPGPSLLPKDDEHTVEAPLRFPLAVMETNGDTDVELVDAVRRIKRSSNSHSSIWCHDPVYKLRWSEPKYAGLLCIGFVSKTRCLVEVGHFRSWKLMKNNWEKGDRVEMSMELIAFLNIKTWIVLIRVQAQRLRILLDLLVVIEGVRPIRKTLYLHVVYCT